MALKARNEEDPRCGASLLGQPSAKSLTVCFEVVGSGHCWKLDTGRSGSGSTSVHQFLLFLKLGKMLKLPSAGLLL